MPDLMIPPSFDTPAAPAQPQSFAMPQGFDDPQQQAFDAQQRAFEAQQKAFETQQQAFRMPQNDPTAGTVCTVCGMRCMAGVRYCPSCGTELTQL